MTREQIEKMWSGCIHCTQTNARQNLGYQYCEHCGRPLTDKAVKMLCKKLEGMDDDNCPPEGGFERCGWLMRMS